MEVDEYGFSKVLGLTITLLSLMHTCIHTYIHTYIHTRNAYRTYIHFTACFYSKPNPLQEMSASVTTEVEEDHGENDHSHLNDESHR